MLTHFGCVFFVCVCAQILLLSFFLSFFGCVHVLLVLVPDFRFIANCCSFVFTSSTLYRVIKCCAMILWFHFEFTTGESYELILFLFIRILDCVCVSPGYASGLDKSLWLQFNSNRYVYVMPLRSIGLMNGRVLCFMHI